MTLPFQESHSRPEYSGLFVLVHLGRTKRRLSLADGSTAGVLAHCRIALAHARAINMSVAFITARPRNFRSQNSWIKDLEPRGRDMVFSGANPSCYASRYFAEAANIYHTLVIAGFLDSAACVATVADVLRAGHDAIFLRDAIAGAALKDLPVTGLRYLQNCPISVRSTAAWKSATGCTPVRLSDPSFHARNSFPPTQQDFS